LETEEQRAGVEALLAVKHVEVRRGRGRGFGGVAAGMLIAMFLFLENRVSYFDG